jgi:hypothetical protein
MADVIEEDFAGKRQLAAGLGACALAHERALLFVAGLHGESGRAPTPAMV